MAPYLGHKRHLMVACSPSLTTCWKHVATRSTFPQAALSLVLPCCHLAHGQTVVTTSWPGRPITPLTAMQPPRPPMPPLPLSPRLHPTSSHPTCHLPRPRCPIAHPSPPRREVNCLRHAAYSCRRMAGPATVLLTSPPCTPRRPSSGPLWLRTLVRPNIAAAQHNPAAMWPNLPPCCIAPPQCACGHCAGPPVCCNW